MLITDKHMLEQYDSRHRLWQGIPSVERTRNGRLFACFYSGGVTEKNGNFAVLCVSDDDGRTFSEPIAVADMGPDMRAFDAVLWMDPLDRLWFVWAVMPENRVEFVRCANPDADELTWEPVRRLGYDIMLNKPIVTSNGDWLFPCAVWQPGVTAGEAGGSDGNPTGAHVFISRDQGETFELYGTAFSPEKDRIFDEHMLLEKKNGELMMYLRTRKGIAESISTDGGKTWCPGYYGNLSGPNSRFHIRRLRSGSVLLVNHYQFNGRNNLTAMISDDEGQTICAHLLLDEREQVSYPDMAESEDGFLYIIYDRERGAHYEKDVDYSTYAKEILMAKITEEDIRSGHLLNPDSRLKGIVSKL